MHIDLFAGVKHGFDRRFGFVAGISADHCLRRDRKAEFRYQTVGKLFRLVGDNAPFQAASVQFANQFIDSVEQNRVAVKTTLVFGQIFLVPPAVFGMFLTYARAESDQTACAVTGNGADIFYTFLRQAVPAQQSIQCTAQIQSGIGQRAVEIE